VKKEESKKRVIKTKRGVPPPFVLELGCDDCWGRTTANKKKVGRRKDL
jgi:hypothetical protein